MSTITAFLEPDQKGFVHLSVPPELRSGRIKVTATLEAAETESGAPGILEMNEFGWLVGTNPLAPSAMTSEFIKAQAYGDE